MKKKNNMSICNFVFAFSFSPFVRNIYKIRLDDHIFISDPVTCSLVLDMKSYRVTPLIIIPIIIMININNLSVLLPSICYRHDSHHISRPVTINAWLLTCSFAFPCFPATCVILYA